MDEFKARMDQRIWDMYHIEVEHLCAINPDGTKKTYEQMFYHVPIRKNSQSVQVERERERTGTEPEASTGIQRSGSNGVNRSSNEIYRIKGFPLATGVTYCQKLKQRARLPSNHISLVQKAQDRQGADPFSPGRDTTRPKKTKIVEYIGIAADEPKRHRQLNERKRAPLVEFDIDEELCGLYCRYNDILSPSYETSFRDGCWFCHNQGVDQLRLLRRNYPELWAILMKWDLDSPTTFKADGHTVHDYDLRFQLEDERKIPTARGFRWEMLECPPKFVAWEMEEGPSLFMMGGKNEG
jgi:hypothetical protein